MDPVASGWSNRADATFFPPFTNVSCTDEIVDITPAVSLRCKTTRYAYPLERVSPETVRDATLIVGWAAGVGAVGLLLLQLESIETKNKTVRCVLDRNADCMPHLCCIKLVLRRRPRA